MSTYMYLNGTGVNSTYCQLKQSFYFFGCSFGCLQYNYLYINMIEHNVLMLTVSVSIKCSNICQNDEIVGDIGDSFKESKES